MAYSKQNMSAEEFLAAFREKNKMSQAQTEELEKEFSEFDLQNDDPQQPETEREGDYTPQPQIVLPSTGEVIKLLKVPRYKGHGGLNNLVKKDWIYVIENSRDSFDAILYRAVDGVTLPDELDKNFTEINNHQKKLTYEDPILVKVLDSPNADQEHFTAMDAEGGQDSLDGDILLLRIASDFVPHGSVISFYEEVGVNTQRLVSWYVLEVYIYGSQAAGYLYVCTPAMNIIQSPQGEEFN